MGMDTLRPNAAGDSTTIPNQNPTSGAHWDKVDEATADDATTKVYSLDGDTNQTKDLYALPSGTGGANTIDSVVTYVRGLAGSFSGSFWGRIKTNAVEYLSAAFADTVWTTHSTTYVTNPQTGLAWTWTQIDALQAGGDVKSGSRLIKGELFWYVSNITQVYVEVNWTPSTVNVNVSDTGSSSDSPSLQAQSSPTDLGSGSDTPTIQGQPSISDVGSGVDSPTPQGQPAISDVGSGVEVLSLDISFTISETGAGIEAISIDTGAVPINISDLGSGVDVPTVNVSFSISDSGAGSDTGTLTYTPMISDLGAGVDAIASVSVTLTISDSALGTDTPTLSYSPAIADSGSGSEAVTVQASFTVSDVGISVDSASMTASFTLSETGAGVDQPSLQVSFTVSQSGSGVDAPTVQAQISVSQLGSGVDAWTTTYSIPSSDSGSGLDSVVNIEIKVSDSNSSRTETITLTADVTVTEAGTGVDAITLLVSQFLVDLGTLQDTAALSAYPSVSDIAFSVDIAYRIQGEVDVDGVKLPHVLDVFVEELSNMDQRATRTTLPYNEFLGKSGRRLSVKGWATSDDFATLEGLADGKRHSVILPTGDGFWAYILFVVPNPEPSDYGHINYEMKIVETVD